MTNSISQKFKKNILVLTVIITVIFIVINISLYIINNNYLINKVDEENTALLQISTHIINDSDIDIALEYIEHYTHIHQVDIEVLDESQKVLFSSDANHLFATQYQIQTLKGTFTVFIDNKESVTVKAIESNTIYVNIALLIIYLLALVVLLRNNKIYSGEIDQDINNVLKLIDSEKDNESKFNHIEFEHIYETITKYLENIDLLTEQKSMNMKGLAHDIKTPLTIIYSYFERIIKNEKVSKKEAKTSFDAAIRMNELLNDIIEDNRRQSNKKINISDILSKKLNEYISIFTNKEITIKRNIDSNISLKWNKKDFERVIDNIISNAYYYSDKATVFKVNARSEDKIYIEFISKPQNIIDIDPISIFKKGVRGSFSHDDNSYGKGFGLYLCRLLLSQIGASIKVNILDKNVKFTIIL